MSAKIALITDTACDLEDEIIKKYNIKLVPFRIIYSDRELKDRFEISSNELYNSLQEEIPTTSLPSMEDMTKVFQEIEKEGYTHAIFITLSSGLSGCFNAAKIVSEDFPNITTYVCDSLSISLSQGGLVTKCGDMINEGKTFEEIVNKLPDIRKNLKEFFVVGTLEYLKKGGRIGKVSGTIAEILNIKPIISIDKEDGKYFTYDKVRGRKQSLNRLTDIVTEVLEDKNADVYIVHGNSEEEAMKVYEELKKISSRVHFGGVVTPVIGVHSGPGFIGAAIVIN